MNRKRIVTLLIPGLLFIFGYCNSKPDTKDRQPAVAGQFYPANRADLNNTLKELFSKAVPRKKIENIIALISPHAGYIFSGEVAASSYNQLDPEKEYDNIFIIGSSHYIAFDGASIYSEGDFITPLGKVKVNRELCSLLIKKYDFFSNREDAHSKEHSLEVQLPFLQYRLKKEFKIVPIVIGSQSLDNCKRIAEALSPYLNTRNLFVVSTDFSHYPSYDDACTVDKATSDAILTNSPSALIRSMEKYESKGITNLATCLCGYTSVLTLMYMTEKKPGAVYDHILYKNSGDSEAGNTPTGRKQVVGYNAIVVFLKGEGSRAEFDLKDADKKKLLSIARRTIEEYVGSRKVPEIQENDITVALKTSCGAFVTLKKSGELRGCVGRFGAVEPLYKVIREMAVAASTQDYRFKPVTRGELGEIEIEISVLTPIRRINSIDELKLGKHGIYIRKGNSSGTFLPQVATETGWTKEEFLGHCAQDKAGIGWNGWKDAELYVYEALVFGEKDFEIK
jgi:AmmeMemoRadiSam system protein B/AmmeMemoRadiSam system protein A